MADEIQQYLFNNKESISDGHYVKLMDMCANMYTNAKEIHKVTALFPKMYEEATTLGYQMVHLYAPLSKEEIEAWKLSGTMNLKSLLGVERMHAFVWGPDDIEQYSVAELDWKVVPVLQISTPATQRAEVGTQYGGPQAEEGERQAEGDVEEVREEHHEGPSTQTGTTGTSN